MKKALLILVVLAMALRLGANPVDLDRAMTMASSFLRLKMEAQGKTDKAIVLRQCGEELQLTNLYLFTGEHCFLIMSADDRAYPILGYSLDQGFDVKGISENTASWLQAYHDDIQLLKEQCVEATTDVDEAWQALSDGVLQYSDDRAAVAPMLSTCWGQGEPFNYYCPNHMATGCVATAIAQIMRYWEYPNQGNSSHSYYHPTYGSLQVNFGSTTYDWDHMPLVASSSSPTEVQQALGVLSYHCGVAFEMDYGSEVSGANSWAVLNAMVDYFRYSNSIVLNYKHLGFDDSSWKTFIKDELKRSRPLYYAGESSTGAHGFVCDGFDNSDYFHINWGWNGRNNGYYMIGSLNPQGEGSYNEYNHVITGIEPLPVSVAAPSNLTAYVDEDQVRLSWDASSGASYYKVYRDDEVIAPQVTTLWYIDTEVGPGDHVYYVRGVNASGERSRRSNAVVANTPMWLPRPVGMTSSVESNTLLLSWDMPVSEDVSLCYGSSTNPGSSYGYGGTYPTYWAQRYPVDRIADYHGMAVSMVSCYFKYSDTFTLYVCQGNAIGVTEVVHEQQFVVSSPGNKEVYLNKPVFLDGSKDLWVVMYCPTSTAYPATSCSYYGMGLPDASYISSNFSSWHSNSEDNVSWMMSVKLSVSPYSYRIKKDDVLVGVVDGAMEFTDNDLSVGAHSYRVTTVCEGLTSLPSADYDVEIVKNDVTVVGSGRVEGDGFAQVGDWVQLKAVPLGVGSFKGWKENGVTISNNQTLSFHAEHSRQLEACFTGAGVEEEQDARIEVYPNPAMHQLHVESPFAIRQIEVVDMNGSVLMTREMNSSAEDLSLKGFAQGLYYLRMLTDEGFIIKKIVVEE